MSVFHSQRMGVRRLLRTLTACAAVAVAAVGITACGSGDKGSAGKAPAATTVPSTHDEDGDIDSLGQGGRYDNDNDAILGWGPPAGAVDRRAIVALVRRYYETAAAGDGAKACSMLDPLMVEAVKEGRNGGSGPQSPPGSTCAQIMTSLFQRRHRELVEDVAAFRIAVVQQHGNRAMALTDFSPTRLWQVLVRRTHGVWRMDTPLYSGAE
jgi:hypothetical protein